MEKQKKRFAEKYRAVVELENFIGIFPNVVDDKMCSEFINYFNAISKQGLTMSSMDIAYPDGDSRKLGTTRKDEVVHIPSGLPTNCFPSSICQPIWNTIQECYKIYDNEYNIDKKWMSYSFNIIRVRPTGGYHVWHHEHNFFDPLRMLAWMIILEAPESGGETEFLHQSVKIKPKVGQLTMWPAAFTHKHRGNPPLEGQKTYLTGWFHLAPDNTK